MNLFVYGTLMPGQSRWAALEPFAVGAPVSAQVPGRLYRTPHGWPAAVFAGDDDEVVPGVLAALDPRSAQDALAELDLIEGVSTGLFQRIEVSTVSGELCATYHWPHPTAGFEPITSWVPAERPKTEA